MSITELQEILDYDKETGDFRWTDKASPNVRSKPANTKDKLGYVCLKVKGKTYKAHRIAWFFCYGKWPEKSIDHINGNPSDNRIANLREVSHAVNLQNQRRARSDNKSGFLGVSPNGKKWRAEIRVDGKKINLGTYATPQEAHQVYVQAKRGLHEGATL